MDLPTRRRWIGAMILLALAGCRDIAAPAGGPTVPGPDFTRTPDTTITFVLQDTTAPRLEDYRFTFWAYKGTEADVAVNYLPAGDGETGQPFLRFSIPMNGLATYPDGTPFKHGDSVAITVTIDTSKFDVHFEPSGLQFSNIFPATFALWYGNANPDLNGDGMVNGIDKQLAKQLGFWYHARTWSPITSQNDTSYQWVSSDIYHFSEYALAY